MESNLIRAGLWDEVKDRLSRPGAALSGGQQQRLCIARALAVQPKVLLMDEPCSALDPTSTRRIEQTIAELQSQVTIVIVTHNMQQAARVSEQAAFFLAEQGTPGAIVESAPPVTSSATPKIPAPRTTSTADSDDRRPHSSCRFGSCGGAAQDHVGARAFGPIFHGTAGAIGMVVLAVTAGIGLYLGYQAIPTLRHYGLSFFTQTQWLPELDRIGIAAVLVGTAEVALVAMVVSFPLALGLALFVSDYAPKWTKSWFVSAVDLMAAVPSIVYGLWGFFLLQPHAILVARWLSQYLGWIPIFKVDTDPNAAIRQQSRYTSSVFIAGLAVAMMTIPLATAVMRAVFDQAPIGERELAMALGGTRFGVARWWYCHSARAASSEGRCWH